MGLTITEALAEIKTVQKRIVKKREFITAYLVRPERLKDPHEKDGGSAMVVTAETQAVRDLEQRVVDLRLAIADANFKTQITIDGEMRTIQEWLTWRREVAPNRQGFLGSIRQRIEAVRREAATKGLTLKPDGATEVGPNDILVSLNEAQLGKEIEHLETILGTLDGQLSLKNATTTISENGAAA